jgi:hypothetical protein
VVDVEKANEYARPLAVACGLPLGELSAAFFAGLMTERARWYQLLMQHSRQGSMRIETAGVIQELAELGRTPPTWPRE